MHMLHKQRLSGKKIKQLLPEKAVIGIFLYVIKKQIWFSRLELITFIYHPIWHSIRCIMYLVVYNKVKRGFTCTETVLFGLETLGDVEGSKSIAIEGLFYFRLISRYNFTSFRMQLSQLLS